MYDADVSISDDLLGDIQNAARHFPEEIREYAKRDLRPFVSKEVDIRLRQEPPPAKKPIEWTSRKQQRYVIAKLRREGNLPYRRTHRLAHGWHVIGEYDQGLTAIHLYNDNPVTGYVYGGSDDAGYHQQQFHINTGWPNVTGQMQVISLLLDERIEQGLPGLLAYLEGQKQR